MQMRESWYNACGDFDGLFSLPNMSALRAMLVQLKAHPKKGYPTRGFFVNSQCNEGQQLLAELSLLAENFLGDPQVFEQFGFENLCILGYLDHNQWLQYREVNRPAGLGI